MKLEWWLHGKWLTLTPNGLPIRRLGLASIRLGACRELVTSNVPNEEANFLLDRQTTGQRSQLFSSRGFGGVQVRDLEFNVHELHEQCCPRGCRHPTTRGS